MSTSVNALSPTSIAVEERVLEDLRSRLRATIWPEDDGNEDGRYGVPRALLQELAQYWAEEYDWRAAERAMNAYEHYLVDVSGTRVHFMRKPGVGPDPTPLILSHGRAVRHPHRISPETRPVHWRPCLGSVRRQTHPTRATR